VAWLLLLSLLPLDRLGELSLLDELVVFFVLDDDVDVLVDWAESAAWAATPTATVPATLAATSALVISDVRRNPVSRFIGVAPLSLTTQRIVPRGSRSGLCGSCGTAVKVFNFPAVE